MRKVEINKDIMLGELIDGIPQSAAVIQKYFQGGCYRCPSMRMETLEMAAELHGHDVNVIIEEIKSLINQ